MDNLQDKLPDHYVYSHPVIEFMTVVAQTCKLLEHTDEYDQEEFIETLLKMLPLLYQKTIMLKQPEEEIDGFLEQFVTEDDYNEIAGMIKDMLGENDAYLEVFHADMQLSDTPVLAFISENLADIYQELKNLAGNYQTVDIEVMTAAIAATLNAFSEHWGEKLLNALRALHHLYFQPHDEDDSYRYDEPAEHSHKNCGCAHHHDESDRREDLFNFFRNE